MNSLMERLAARGAEEILWITSELKPVDVGRFTSACQHLDTDRWHGKRVALGEMPILEFVSVLVFLDGLAETILLLPTEEDGQRCSARLLQANIDVVLDQGGLGLSAYLRSDEVHPRPNAGVNVERRRRAHCQTTWLLPTSGTTGAPKLVPHTFASLTRSMSVRSVGDEYVWGSLYGLRRFAGLQVFFQSWIAGAPFVLSENEGDLTVTLNRLITLGCNALSATPSMWRRVFMHPLLGQLDLKQITLGGEIVDQSILDMLRSKFPKARLTHIFASTEVGVGFAVRDEKSGFPMKYLNDPPGCLAMRVDDSGHLWFRNRQQDAVNEGCEWVDSGDVVRLEHGRVHFVGRASGSINVGGNKVMPEEIESAIKELPEVALVQVRARKSAIMGNLVEALITAVPGTVFDEEFKKKVTLHCKARLAPYKVPALIVKADEIDLTSSGKLPRACV